MRTIRASVAVLLAILLCGAPIAAQADDPSPDEESSQSTASDATEPTNAPTSSEPTQPEPSPTQSTPPADESQRFGEPGTQSAGPTVGRLSSPSVSSELAAAAAPVANDDTYSTAAGTALVVTGPGLLANDTDVPANSRAVSGGVFPANGGIQFDNEGGFTYTPNAGFSGTNTFNYCVEGASQGSCASNKATVTITVTGGAATPVAVDDAYTTTAGTALVVPGPGLLANDTNVPVNSRAVSGGVFPDNGTLSFDNDGGFTYTPGLGFSGTNTFNYCVEGASLGSCASNKATVTITVTPPVAVDDAYSTPPGTALVVTGPGLLANDTDVPPNSRAVSGGVFPANGGIQFDNGGGFTYTPDAGFSGTNTFNYCIEGASLGSCASNKATVTITVATPVANDDAYTTAVGTTLTMTGPGLLANDENVPPNSRAVSGGVFPANGMVQFDNDGGFIYTPDSGFTGTNTFNYCIEGGGVGSCASNKATVTITVVAAIPPVAVPDEFDLQTCEVAFISVLDNDPDVTELSVPTVVAPAAHGTLTPFESFLIYEPDEGFVGDDAFTYTYSAAGITSNTATATIHVTPCDEDPGDSDGGDSDDDGHDGHRHGGKTANDDDDAALADTGSTLRLWVLALAGMSIAAGTAIVRISARRNEV